jgi:hypothetical protein
MHLRGRGEDYRIKAGLRERLGQIGAGPYSAATAGVGAKSRPTTEITSTSSISLSTIEMLFPERAGTGESNFHR